MEKKAELTTKQLVTIIILIISFAVILFLLMRLDLGGATNKEVCHNSVVMVGKSDFIGSLDCRTDYDCISAGGDCSDFSETQKIEAKTEEEIKNAIQKEINDCWWMFGNGTIDYVGYNWKVDKFVGTGCAICDIVKFDEKIQQEFSTIEFDEEIIDTSQKYSIITGMKGENDYIEAKIIESNKISEEDCDEFVTKA